MSIASAVARLLELDRGLDEALRFPPPLLMIVFRGKYSRWWYGFKAASAFILVTDQCPPFRLSA